MAKGDFTQHLADAERATRALRAISQLALADGRAQRGRFEALGPQELQDLIELVSESLEGALAGIQSSKADVSPA
jgi:hypothetical protein